MAIGHPWVARHHTVQWEPPSVAARRSGTSAADERIVDTVPDSVTRVVGSRPLRCWSASWFVRVRVRMRQRMLTVQRLTHAERKGRAAAPLESPREFDPGRCRDPVGCCEPGAVPRWRRPMAADLAATPTSGVAGSALW